MSRDLLALDDRSGAELTRLLERAQDMAGLWDARRMPPILAGRRVALVVNDDGWRNTTAFDLGIAAMGGICTHAPLRWDTREDLPDLAAYLDNWFDGIVTRAPDLATLRRLAAAARAPVINARTRQNHPCETLGDLAFHFSRHGRIDGMTVAVIAPHANILGSWIEAAACLPIKVVQVYPAAWHAATQGVPRFSSTEDMCAVAEADLLITDCWPADADPAQLAAYRVTGAVLDGLHPGARFVPCPPVARGKEVAAAAMTHPACQVTAAKAFLLHTQNALLEWAFTG